MPSEEASCAMLILHKDTRETLSDGNLCGEGADQHFQPKCLRTSMFETIREKRSFGDSN